MHFFCGSSFHLQPKKFKYKIWIENDLKEASLNFLHVKKNQKELVLETEKQNKTKLPEPGPLATAPEAVPPLSARTRGHDSDAQEVWLTWNV